MKRTPSQTESAIKAATEKDLGETLKKNWYLRVGNTHLLPELWRSISDQLNLLDYVHLSQVCVGVYYSLDTFKVVVSKGLDSPRFSTHGFTPISLSTLLHPIRWALWTGNWDPEYSFETLFQEYLMELDFAKMFRTLAHCDGLLVVAGGYVRSLLLEFLRKHLCQEIKPYKLLTPEFNDVDIWINDTKLTPHFRQKFFSSLPGKRSPGVTSTQFYQNYTWNNLKLQYIHYSHASVLDVGMYSLYDYKTPFANQVIGKFDFNCTQFSLSGSWYELFGGDCIVTPYALWSLLDGVMFSRNLRVNPVRDSWFMKLDDKAWITKCDDGWDTRDPVIWGYRDARTVFRTHKYLNRGHHWIGMDTKEIERFKQRLNMVNNLSINCKGQFGNFNKGYDDEGEPTVRDITEKLIMEDL